MDDLSRRRVELMPDHPSCYCRSDQNRRGCAAIRLRPEVERGGSAGRDPNAYSDRGTLVSARVPNMDCNISHLIPRNASLPFRVRSSVRRTGDFDDQFVPRGSDAHAA